MTTGGVTAVLIVEEGTGIPPLDKIVGLDMLDFPTTVSE